MNPALIGMIASVVVALIEHGPTIVADIKEMLENTTGVPNKDELIARIDAAQAKWPEWV